MTKDNCEDHIYDTEGFCEWRKDNKVIRQTFSKCDTCGNGIAGHLIELRDL